MFVEVWTFVRKAVECFKHCLMGHTNRSMEDGGAKNYLNCGVLAQEVLEESFSMLLRDYSCDILVKEVTTFCFCP